MKMGQMSLPRFETGRIMRSLVVPEDYGVRLHNVPECWKETRGAGITVAVLDTGCPDHPDLVISEFKNFTADPVMDTVSGHSTHVSGIIGARGGDHGLTGIAPECSLITGKILDNQGQGSDVALAEGIRWAIEAGAKVVNMSLGAPPSAKAYFKRTVSALNLAYEQGVMVICASGNENAGKVSLPACLDTTIAVGAVNSARERSWFSNRGRHLSFAAAGENVLSTFKNDTYCELSGTSMASPHIAGLCALILSSHLNADKETPIKDLEDMIEHLRRISVDFGTKGFDEDYGWGIPIFGHINPDAPKVEDVEGKIQKGFSFLDSLMLLLQQRLK